ncbi:hypothetical protein CKAH01_17916 [Colletotrichum kahawae]|uniref:Uncharacterized protein n=1 Tax=Colletotrichum kahawae TaxID=34407 RepID=A0AAD9Y8K2_COLKA|nr:hypothetical protein CKAH01_17916 [Colletotrichum kahawae]
MQTPSLPKDPKSQTLFATCRGQTLSVTEDRSTQSAWSIRGNPSRAGRLFVLGALWREKATPLSNVGAVSHLLHSPDAQKAKTVPRIPRRWRPPAPIHRVILPGPESCCPVPAFPWCVVCGPVCVTRSLRNLNQPAPEKHTTTAADTDADD